MNRVKSRTSKLKIRLQQKFSYPLFSHDHLFSNRLNRNKEQKTMMEMWENYLTFNRFEI